MARIRSVKPEFFRHKGLQKLEKENPGQYPMLVFEGLWTQSDKDGRFQWDADYLHLDILPFITFDFVRTLQILKESAFIKEYEVDGKVYGLIPSFRDHQRISGKESESDAKYPPPPEKQQGSTGEAPEKQPESPQMPLEREREREREEERTHGEFTREGNDGEAPEKQPESGRKPGEYPHLLFQAWGALGERVYQPDSEITFLNRYAVDIAPWTKGHRSDDVLAAIENFGKIVGRPGYYWQARIGMSKFLKDHLPKFIPKKFRTEDFRTREDDRFDSPEDVERRLELIRAGRTG